MKEAATQILYNGEALYKGILSMAAKKENLLRRALAPVRHRNIDTGAVHTEPNNAGSST